MLAGRLWPGPAADTGRDDAEAVDIDVERFKGWELDDDVVNAELQTSQRVLPTAFSKVQAVGSKNCGFWDQLHSNAGVIFIIKYVDFLSFRALVIQNSFVAGNIIWIMG